MVPLTPPRGQQGKPGVMGLLQGPGAVPSVPSTHQRSLLPDTIPQVTQVSFVKKMSIEIMSFVVYYNHNHIF